MIERATVESGVRVLVAMIVGAFALRINDADQGALAAFLGPVIWFFLSVYWSKQSDKAIKGG